MGKDPFEHLPMTFHIESGLKDKEFVNFRKYFNSLKEQIAAKREEVLAAIKLRRGDHPDTLDDETLETKYGVILPKNIWITKPGENSNRGCGISVCDTMQEIIKEVQESAKQGHTHII